ncbi:MAG TPA: TatD family deoxyribonuclease [Methanosarcinaceae archaeon]|nr:TatD family deoxyribonuclease [Methanosarcinaceae archaeon]
MMIDSHCHLDFPQFNSDCHETIERALSAGVVEAINSGVDYKTNLSTLALADKYDHIHATLGLGPGVAVSKSEEEISRILSRIEQNIEKAVGVGEAGLDYFHCKTDSGRARQANVFKKVIEIAETVDKPLVIHGRDAEYESLELVRHLDNVVFHCYSGSLETMNLITDAGYYISIATLVCFSKHHQNLVKHLPIKRMIIETDSPYLSPRKGRNEPAFLADSVATIAKLRGMEEMEVAKVTAQNTRRVFGL